MRKIIAEMPAQLDRCKKIVWNVRRLVASAPGKLAWMGVDQAAAVAALAPMARHDPHLQTRQYAIKALKAHGAAAQACQHDLRDIEYWGMDTPQYKMSMYKKEIVNQQEGKRLISVYPPDLSAVDRRLEVKLRHFRIGA